MVPHLMWVTTTICLVERDGRHSMMLLRARVETPSLVLGVGQAIRGDHYAPTRTTGKARDGQRDGPNVDQAVHRGAQPAGRHTLRLPRLRVKAARGSLIGHSSSLGGASDILVRRAAATALLWRTLRVVSTLTYSGRTADSSCEQ